MAYTPVVPDDVLKLINTDQDVSVFIDTARLLVQEQLVGKGLSDSRLRQLELYLAAHFTAISVERGALTSDQALEARQTYGGDFGPGLTLTRFGQQALVLDTSGTLNEVAKPKRTAQFRVVQDGSHKLA